MGSDSYRSGDVFWAPDPYHAGGNPRPWLVLAAENIPYAGEEFICAALTQSDLPDNVAVQADDWIVGNDTETQSYCSPWVVATIKHDSVTGGQGYVTDAFTETIIEQSVAYLSGDSRLER